MWLPKRIEKLIDRRAKLAADLMDVDYELSEWIDKLQGRDKDFSIFYEPDLNNVATAIAVEDSGKLFRKLKLVG